MIKKIKYNKIILISNVGIDLEGREFIDEARKIIGNDIIVLFLAYSKRHLKWIKNYKNALYSNVSSFWEKYINCFNDEFYDKEGKILELKQTLENHYKFEYEENDVLHLSGCFKSYIDHDKNEVLNKLDEKNCKVMDNDWNVINSNEDLNNIIKLVSNLKHDIILSDVVKLNDDYYVIIGLNVNFWSPYYLYKYEDNKLKRIYCFDGEKIISLK